jgi:hypothetical protein
VAQRSPRGEGWNGQRRGCWAGRKRIRATAHNRLPRRRQSGPSRNRPTNRRLPRSHRCPKRKSIAHFLALGYDPEQIVLHNSDLIFTASREGSQVVTYASRDTRASGFIWPDTEKRLAGSPYLIAEKLGRGHVLLFADDPNFRLLWPRLTKLFVNAVFLAPSIP